MHLQTNSSLWSQVQHRLPGDLQLEEAVPYLSGNSDGKKTVIRFFPPDESTPRFVIKGSQDAGCRRALETEVSVLRFLQSRVQAGMDLGFSAPVSVMSFEDAGWRYTTETAAHGRPLSELIFLHSQGSRWNILQDQLLRAAQSSMKIPDAFHGQSTVRLIDAAWYQVPTWVNVDGSMKSELALEGAKWANSRLCAHGDFTIENVFWESSYGISVIDWELPMLGVPPAYDAFTLLLSSLPALDLELSESGDHPLLAQFQAAFFGTGRWARGTRELLQKITPGDTSRLWLQMMMCLVIRSNYFLWRQPAIGKQYFRLLEVAAEQKERFVLREPFRTEV